MRASDDEMSKKILTDNLHQKLLALMTRVGKLEKELIPVIPLYGPQRVILSKQVMNYSFQRDKLIEDINKPNISLEDAKIAVEQFEKTAFEAVALAEKKLIAMKIQNDNLFLLQEKLIDFKNKVPLNTRKNTTYSEIHKIIKNDGIDVIQHLIEKKELLLQSLENPTLSFDEARKSIEEFEKEEKNFISNFPKLIEVFESKKNKIDVEIEREKLYLSLRDHLITNMNTLKTKQKMMGGMSVVINGQKINVPTGIGEIFDVLVNGTGAPKEKTRFGFFKNARTTPAEFQVPNAEEIKNRLLKVQEIAENRLKVQRVRTNETKQLYNLLKQLTVKNLDSAVSVRKDIGEVNTLFNVITPSKPRLR